MSAVDHNEDESFTEGDLMSPTRQNTTIGFLDRRPSRALQNRAAFLNGRPSYLLYFWEVAESHQLIQLSLQRVTKNADAVDASSAPSVTSTHSGSTPSGGSRNQWGQWHHGQEEQQDQQLFTPLMELVRNLAESQRQMRIDRERDRVHEQDMEGEGVIQNDKNSFAIVFSNIKPNWLTLHKNIAS